MLFQSSIYTYILLRFICPALSFVDSKKIQSRLSEPKQHLVGAQATTNPISIFKKVIFPKPLLCISLQYYYNKFFLFYQIIGGCAGSIVPCVQLLRPSCASPSTAFVQSSSTYVQSKGTQNREHRNKAKEGPLQALLLYQLIECCPLISTLCNSLCCSYLTISPFLYSL